MKLVLKSILVCPNCGFKKEEIMPTNSCQYFYKCDSCEYIKPKYLDCCVFLALDQYTFSCPSIQKENCC